MLMEELIPLRLAREGFGSLDQIANMRADVVLDAFHYSVYLAEFQETVYELNREK